MPAPASHGGINLGSLDSMVASYMAFEGLTEDSGGPDCNREMKRKCERVREKIICGEMEAARKLLDDISTNLLKDTRLEFLVKKQVLVELLRKGGPEGDIQALGWIRKQLAPLAMDAYPEAYNEFKRTLLMLVYDRKQENSPVAEEWAEKSRENLANLIFSTTRKTTGFKDPDLVNLLKYLMCIHNQFYMESTDTSPEFELIKKLKIDERMPPPLPEETPGSAAPFPEKDVQAIVQAVGITRHEAIEALKHSEGDVSTAFENEIGRIQLNLNELNHFILEYAGYRGLLQVQDLEKEGNEDEKISSPDKMEIVEESVVEEEVLVKCNSGKAEKMAGKTDSNSEWKGLEILMKSVEHTYDYDPKLRKILRLVRMVKEGKYMEVMEQIKQLDPEMFNKHPRVLFELWRFEILRIAGGGAHDMALDLLRKKLTPIVNVQKDLFPALQETLSVIMSAKQDPPSPSNLCSTIQTALQDALDLPGPALVKLLRNLLATHKQWFKKQRCQDIFAKNLGIDVLRCTADVPQGPSSTPPGTAGPLAANTGSGRLLDDGIVVEGTSPGYSSESELEGDESDVSVDEESIVHLMEISAFPRSTVIELLVQHDGNIRAAVETILSQTQ